MSKFSAQLRVMDGCRLTGNLEVSLRNCDRYLIRSIPAMLGI